MTKRYGFHKNGIGITDEESDAVVATLGEPSQDFIGDAEPTMQVQAWADYINENASLAAAGFGAETVDRALEHSAVVIAKMAKGFAEAGFELGEYTVQEEE